MVMQIQKDANHLIPFGFIKIQIHFLYYFDMGCCLSENMSFSAWFLGTSNPLWLCWSWNLVVEKSADAKTVWMFKLGVPGS